MEQIATIIFTDVDSAGEAVAIVRASAGNVALALSRREDADIEVFLRPDDARKLIDALGQAISVANTQ